MAKHCIDYSKPANEILWDCLMTAAYDLIAKKHLVLRRDEYEGLALDMAIKAHPHVIRDLDKWDHDYPFHTFVYYRVWGVASALVKTRLREIKYRLNIVPADRPLSEHSNETIIATIGNADRLTYDTYKHRTVHNGAKARQNREHRLYLDYLDDCAEFGCPPLTEQEFLHSA